MPESSLARQETAHLPQVTRKIQPRDRASLSRSRALAPTPAGAGKTQSVPAVRQSKGQSFGFGDAESNRLNRAKQKLVSKSVFDRLGDSAEDSPSKKAWRQLDENVLRNWVVSSYAAEAQAGQPQLVDRFLEALKQAGCDYQKENPLRESDYLTAPKKDADVEGLAKEESLGGHFIVVAKPQQLVELRELVGRFATISNAVELLSATRSLDHAAKDWDGSKIPRDDFLDPPGDARTFRFWVKTETEPSEKP